MLDAAPKSYSKTSGMMFRPPLPNFLVQTAVKILLPLLFAKSLKGYSVQVDEASLERLRKIKGERCLLLPNHPSQWDPWAMFQLGRLIGESFFYLAAREVFDWHHGLQGWLMQRVGCYSVVRGASDKDSFKTTKEILGTNRGRLVIFVEGEISNQNDSLLPLEPGVIQLAFLALQDVYKQVGKDLAKLPSLYVCPIAIKHFYSPKNLEHTIECAVTELENATGLSSNSLSYYERVRAIGYRVLQEAASQVGYVPKDVATLDQQIKGLEDFMLYKLEQIVNLPPEAELSYLDRVRRIRNTIDRVLKDHPEEKTLYQERLLAHQKDVLQNFYWDLERIVNFIAIYDGYLSPDMIPERYVEVIRRLEKEVFGGYHLIHPRTAVLQVLDPIDLKPRFEHFLQDKKKTSEELVRHIEQVLYQAITQAQGPAKSSV